MVTRVSEDLSSADGQAAAEATGRADPREAVDSAALAEVAEVSAAVARVEAGRRKCERRIFSASSITIASWRRSAPRKRKRRGKFACTFSGANWRVTLSITRKRNSRSWACKRRRNET